MPPNRADHRTSGIEIARRYVGLLATPTAPDELRATVDELVAGDHVAYETSWGTLLGRTALKEFIETARAAFPTLSYRVTDFASADEAVYCQWRIADDHWTPRADDESGSSADWRTMALRFSDALITETWHPCDPWVAPSADPILHPVVPSRR